ncbi:MAG: metal-dependent hydrolase [Myxococcales bacterium]|nr:metal-dependent hydrolase [Myxococcales bacterium]
MSTLTMDKKLASRRADSQPSIEVRNRSFPIGPAIPRDWHGGRRSVSRFFDNLSVFFPEGERFFMRSLQAFRHVVADDPAMRRAIRDFCAQEGIHGREHERYNASVRDAGYPVEAMEARVTRLLAFVQRVLPKRAQLGATAALEHFTALMGHVILERPEIFADAHPTMRELWLWHAAEENEHKAVAYDVYLAAGGNYPERAVIMALASIIFWAKVIEHQARLMRVDGDLFSPRAHAELLRFLWLEPGGMGKMWRLWLEWFRPSFHPNDIDSGPLLEAWRAAQEVS